MHIDVSQQSPSDIYHLITQTVVPRPIAWVLTDSGEHNYNLAPFSYFTPVSSNPPLLMVSVGKKPSGEVKDTTKNALATKHLVIHIASVKSAALVTNTAATLEHGHSEVTESQIELEQFADFPLPRVKDCAVAFGCELYEVKEIGETPQSLIFSEIKAIYINPEVIDEEASRLKIDALALDPLSRLGGGEYATLDSTFTIERPQ
ncbi:flavin reductase family protein [Vibrio sp. AK197]